MGERCTRDPETTRRGLTLALAAIALAAAAPSAALAPDQTAEEAIPPVGRPAPAPYQPPTSSSLPIGAQEEVPRPPLPGPTQPGYVIRTQEDTLVVGGYVHADARTFLGDGAGTSVSQFLLRQARPVLEGTIRNHFDYRLLTDFSGGKVVVQEAFVDIRYLPWLEVRLGKMKVPVGLERLQNSNAVTFAERGFPTSLVPNRDVGAELFGDLGGVVTYAVGVFNGAVDNGIGESDQDSHKELAGRLFVRPFARTALAPLRGLGLSASGTVGTTTGTLASTQVAAILSPGQASIFGYATGSTGGAPDPAKTVVADGGRTRWDVQGSCYGGPIGLQTEYVVSTQRVRKGAATTWASHRAWEATASLVLTGEEATYRMIVPNQPFDPAAGAWGALELAARYQLIRLDDAIFAGGVFADPTQQVRGATAWGAGVNWYLDRSFRLMASFEHTRFRGGASVGGQEVDRVPEQVLMARSQIVF